MSFHVDYEKWAQLCDPARCPVCNNAPMPKGMEDLYELSYTWLNAEPRDCIKGACHVTSKIHAIELFELNDEQLLGVMREVNLYAKCLKRVTNAVKINIEIHGNTLPHLHVHLYPRWIGDPFPNRCIDYRQKSGRIYAPGEYMAFLNEMRAAIKDELENMKSADISH